MRGGLAHGHPRVSRPGRSAARPPAKGRACLSASWRHRLIAPQRPATPFWRRGAGSLRRPCPTICSLRRGSTAVCHTPFANGESRGARQPGRPASALDGQFALRGLSMFLFLVGQAQRRYGKNIRFEAPANQLAPNPDTARIHTARGVTNKVGARSFLPEFGFLGGVDVLGVLLRFHETIHNSSIKIADS